MSFKKKFWLLVVIGLVVYASSFWNQFIWDDEQFIYRNQYVLNFNLKGLLTQNTIAGAGESSNYYRPLTSLSFAIDHAIWGLRPFGFHLTNTLVHAFAGGILFLLFRELGLDNKRKNKSEVSFSWLTPAFVVALFFLIHPLQTEAVTYINSRGDSFFAFLSLLGLLSFSLSFRSQGINLQAFGKEVNLSSGQLVSLAVVLYALSILAKEIALATAGLFLLVFLAKKISLLLPLLSGKKIEAFFTTHSKWILGLMGVATTAISYLILRASVLNFENSFNFYSGQNVYSSNLGVRLLTFSNIIWTYLRLLFIPYPLHMDRDAPIITDFFNPGTQAALTLVLAILLLIYAEWRKKKSAWIAFGTAWFGVMMLPVSGIVPINGLLYEHWLYLPMIGFWLAVFKTLELLVSLLGKKVEQTLLGQRLLASLVITISLVWVVLTLRQNYLWQNPIRFYNYTLQYTQNARLFNNLGMSYDQRRLYDKSLESYEKALALSPYPQIYHNMGTTYEALGDTDKAIESFEKALELSPNFHISYRNLINLYLETQATASAVPLVDTLLENYPTQVDLYAAKVNIHLRLNQTEQAQQVVGFLKNQQGLNPQLVQLVNQLQSRIDRHQTGQ